MVEGAENQIEAVIHQRTDGNHNHGGNADAEDAADHGFVRTEAAQLDLHFGILFPVQQNGHDKGKNLSDDGCGSGAGDLHPGKTEHSEDQNRIQNDIDDGTETLGEHGIAGASRRLQQPLKQNLPKNTEGDDRNDADIVGAVLDGLRVGREGAHIGLRSEDAEEDTQQHSAEGEENSVEGAAVDLIGIFFTQPTGKQGVDTYGDTRCNTDHDILHRKGKRNRRQGIIVDLGNARDKDAVNHVVKRLHKHGQRHGKCHVKQQPPDRHNPHFVFFQIGHRFRTTFF